MSCSNLKRKNGWSHFINEPRVGVLTYHSTLYKTINIFRPLKKFWESADGSMDKVLAKQMWGVEFSLQNPSRSGHGKCRTLIPGLMQKDGRYREGNPPGDHKSAALHSGEQDTNKKDPDSVKVGRTDTWDCLNITWAPLAQIYPNVFVHTCMHVRARERAHTHTHN